MCAEGEDIWAAILARGVRIFGWLFYKVWVRILRTIIIRVIG